MLENFIQSIIFTFFLAPCRSKLLGRYNETIRRYGHSSQIKINIHEEIPMKEITSNASLALGEAFMDHRIEIEEVSKH